MNPVTNQTPNVLTPSNKLLAKLAMVNDAIRRVHDNLGGEVLNPALCAYIDGQLAKAIGWLASARAIAITQGNLDHPHFDTDEVIDLDQADDADQLATQLLADEGGES